MEQTSSATTPPDHEFLEEFGDQFKDAWNRHDGVAVASLCTEDIVWSDAALPRSAQGRKEVAQFVEAMGRAFPDFHVEELEGRPYAVSSPGPPRIFVPYRISGTWVDDWDSMGLAPTNRSFHAEGIDQWTFRGELLCHYVTYYDSLEIARQLGPLPRVGTFGYRAVARGQRLQAAFLRRSTPRAT
jgi:ketosteroid isomerase-like protein